MNYTFFGLLGLLLASSGVEAAPPGGWGHAPTRLQLCQREVQDASGEQRKRLLRDCLARRVEGEQAVAGECLRQLRLGAKRSAAQQRQLSDCEARALAQPSSQLPRRPVIVAPPPPPSPPTRGATPAADGAGTIAAPATPAFIAPILRAPQPPRTTPPLSGSREGA